jgi:hypothetical protein
MFQLTQRIKRAERTKQGLKEGAQVEIGAELPEEVWARSKGTIKMQPY